MQTDVRAFVIFYNKKENKIMMAKRKDGSWGLFGGTVDRKEKIKKGLRREIKEEAGLSILASNLKLFQVSPRQKTVVYWYVYDHEVSMDIKNVKLNPEHLKCKWVKLTKLVNLKLHYSVSFILNKLLTGSVF